MSHIIILCEWYVNSHTLCQISCAFTHTDLNNVTAFKKCDGETINILEKIGGDYEDFGTKLLSDGGGNVMAEIKNDCRGKAMKIKREIFTRWIRSKGKKPISWETLAGVLKCMGLTVLAQEICQGPQGIVRNVRMSGHIIVICM